jgi:hypothetical protein
MDSSKLPGPLGHTPVSVRIISLHAPDVQAATSDPFKLTLGKDFVSQLQTLEDHADAFAAGIRAQTGNEACRSEATLDARNRVLSIEISVDADVQVHDAQIVARAVNHSLVNGLTDDDARSLTKDAMQVVSQYSLSILKKQGNGFVTVPSATCINESEVARVEGQYLPRPNLSDPKPQRIEPIPAWIPGFDRLNHSVRIKATLPGSKKPQKLTAYCGDEQLQQQCAEIAADRQNRPVVTLAKTRAPGGTWRYELLSVQSP